MTPFKDQIHKDIANVFINPLEFAELHDIDGMMINCVVDQDLYLERGQIKQDEARGGGVYDDTVSLFVSMDDMERPLIDGELMLDGQMYLVAQVIDNMGVYEIQLRARDY